MDTEEAVKRRYDRKQRDWRNVHAGGGGEMQVCVTMWLHIAVARPESQEGENTHTEGPGGLTSAVPKHSTVCVHMVVACVPFHHCEQHASIHTKRRAHGSWKTGGLCCFAVAFDQVSVFVV